MAAHGITGETVANAMLDKLTAMQNATDSARPAQSYANDWGNDIKVEIPNTGVSVGQFYHYLASWLGHEPTSPAKCFEPQTAWLLPRASLAAQQHRSQEAKPTSTICCSRQRKASTDRRNPFAMPSIWFQVPSSEVRTTTAILDHLIEDGPPIDRIWSYLGVATFEDFSDPVHAPIENMKAAVLAPDFALPYINLAQENNLLGHEDAGADERSQGPRTASEGRRNLDERAGPRDQPSIGQGCACIHRMATFARPSFCAR